MPATGRCLTDRKAMHGANDMISLKGHPVVGSSWEGYVVEQIRQLKPQIHYCM
jgi:hypothetical protein